MKNFKQAEELCQAAFLQEGPFWHLCTPGNLTSNIFRTSDDFIYGMNLMARCSLEYPDVRILAFEIMGNHIHQVSAGPHDRVEELFLTFRKRLSRYIAKTDDPVDMSGFFCKLIPVTELGSLRNTIAYVHRNGYVVNPHFTPFSYPWGTGMFFFFNPCKSSIFIKDLTCKEIRSLFKSTDITVPKDFMVYEGYISPSSYCHIDYAMSLFRDAHHYYSAVSKNLEAYSSMGELLGDSVFMTDEELHSGVIRKIREKFGSGSIRSMSPEQKREIARLMHYDLHASNDQIRRILAMPQAEVDAMFPLSKRH